MRNSTANPQNFKPANLSETSGDTAGRVLSRIFFRGGVNPEKIFEPPGSEKKGF